MFLENETTRKILGIHWGFIPGGVAVYARYIEEVGLYAPLSIKSICIMSSKWSFDEKNASHMDMDVISIKGRRDLSWIRKVRKLIEKESPDLILTHGFNGAFVAAVSGHGLNVPVVSSWHGDYFPSTFTQKVRKPLFDSLLDVLFRRYVREIVTVSHFSKRTLVQKRIDEHKIAVVHNGIPSEPSSTEFKGSIRDELQVPDGYLLIGTACRLVEPKGLGHLIEAICFVVSRVQNVRFVIWGEGPQRNQLTRLIDKLNIGKYIAVPGHRDDIDRCISELDIYVVSSFAENFSIALLEAMRSGLPIVATDVGGNPEAIDSGKEGVLVPAADSQALAGAILSLVDDRPKRERMAVKARQRFLAEFTSERMVEQTASWLMTCLSKHRKKA